MKPQNRIQDPQAIDMDLIDKEIKSGKDVIIQFSDRTYDDKKLAQLNGLCSKYNKEFEIRFYGHYSTSFDFETLLKIPNVKSLYVDCLRKANNVEAISQLKNLEKLSLGVFELKETEILNYENLKNLSELILTETRTRAFNLEYLRDYKNLKFLTTSGHTKNMEALGDLENLEFLTLWSVKGTPVSFVNKLKKLKTLKFILGGRDNINEIEENEIENLEIVRVRGFNSLENISKFKGIRSLVIEDNIQIRKIEFDRTLPYIRYINIYNCKSLDSLVGIGLLPSLYQLRIIKTALDFDTLIAEPLPKQLEIFTFCTTKQNIDKRIRETLETKGYRVNELNLSI